MIWNFERGRLHKEKVPLKKQDNNPKRKTRLGQGGWMVVNRNTFEEYKSMEDDIFSGVANGQQIESKVVQTFQKSFLQVQNILDQNRLLISEINLNHESKTPVNLTRNVGLIRDLNNNIRRVVDLYNDLSNSFTKSMEASSEAESKSDTRGGQKRARSGN